MEVFKIFDKDGKGAIEEDNFVKMLEKTRLIKKKDHEKTIKGVYTIAIFNNHFYLIHQKILTLISLTQSYEIKFCKLRVRKIFILASSKKCDK